MIVRKEQRTADIVHILDAFDFTGLVEQKLKDSEAKCLFLRQWTHFTRVRYIFVSTVMVLTALLLIIIKFF